MSCSAVFNSSKSLQQRKQIQIGWIYRFLTDALGTSKLEMSLCYEISKLIIFVARRRN